MTELLAGRNAQHRGSFHPSSRIALRASGMTGESGITASRIATGRDCL
jgi:hypothetical protein